MSAIFDVAEGDMHTWVVNELHHELINMPRWLVCAFGKKNEVGGSEFVFGEAQDRLATYLILKHMDRCPPWAYDKDHRHDWKMSMYVSCFERAWVSEAYKASLKAGTVSS